jgi:hypothetical protein
VNFPTEKRAFGDTLAGDFPIPTSIEAGKKIWEEKTNKISWEPTSSITTPSPITLQSDKWVVMTSINYPTPEVKILAAQPGWKVVVVGDRKTPADWSWENCVFLSVNDQKKLGYR